MAISVDPDRRRHLCDTLARAGVDHAVRGEASVRFRDPDGARIGLVADPLGEMYGDKVL
ncbi:hypothetical protein ACFC00_35770 [Streptomyces adustus]|uniref:hypothetical protein n=1 Tax=Streptomyces adustus TaxID=1609272 RepID=UPI0035E1D868